MMVGKKREKLYRGMRTKNLLNSALVQQHLTETSSRRRLREDVPRKRRHPQVHRSEGHLDPVPVELFVVDIFLRGSTMIIILKSRHNNLLFFGGQELCVRRRMRHEE